MIKLSIVIPTKHRYEQLFIVVKEILAHIKREDYEIVINDNSDDNQEALAFIEAMDDKRISYYYTTEKLSQSGNTNDALDKVKGKYVLFIGDDDVVSPYIMDAIDMMEHRGIECLSYSIGVYYWPNIKVTKPSKIMNPALLLIHQPLSSEPYTRSSETELNKVLANGGGSTSQMPKVYHGVVSSTLLNRMKEVNGTYAVGSCPDMNLAITLTQLIDSYQFVDYPLSLSGVSSNSAAGLSARQSHCASLEQMVANGMLPKSVLAQWNPLLPKVWTISTIYPQALYEALNKFKSSKHINYTAMYSTFFIDEKWAKNIGRKTFRDVVNHGLSSYTQLLCMQIKIKIRSILARLIKPIIGKFIKYPMPILINDVGSIGECMDRLNEIPFTNAN